MTASGRAANHIMIDLETVGTRPGSAILTIWAVRFDPAANGFDDRDPLNLPVESAFYRRIDRDSCARLGLTEDADTLSWWSRQAPKARREAFDADPRNDIADVMAEFARWCGRDPFPWSHGASFDVVLCEAAFERLGQRTPWKFWNVRDTRTLYAFTGINPARDRNHHHALYDAAAQAAAVQRAYACQPRRPRLNHAALLKISATAEAEEACGDPATATALRALLDWHGACPGDGR